MQLNSYKTYQISKDKWLLIIIWMIIAYCLMLFPLLWGNNDGVEKYKPTKHELNLLKSDRSFRACLWCSHYNASTNTCIDDDKWSKRCEAWFPTDTLDERWYPWELNSSWDAQEMPGLTETESHQRFIELCERYNLPADVIWHTENYYWLKEGTILCIAITETSWWTKWWGKEWCWNYWNVANNDRGNRRCFPNQWAWLAAIGQTLNNDNLKNNQTIACLHWAWNCIEPNATGKRYATSESWNRWRNMVWCFYAIYGELINQSTFNLHDR